jgi:ATP-dependent Clp protease ATP-binding subunit ClpC
MSLFDRISRPMQGFNFTERARRVLARSRDEAHRLHHEYVGTEHLLLALLGDENGVVSAVLANLGADANRMRRMIEDTVKPGNAPEPARPELPYTSRAKRVLELMAEEARTLNHHYAGTEHLLLALVAEQKGVAAQVLIDNGVTLERAREATRQLLGAQRPPQPLHVVPPNAPEGSPSEMEPTPSALAQEDAAWRRLGHALDTSARLGAKPTLALEDDGSLTVSLTDGLVVSVRFPPHVRLRRADGTPNA